MTATTQRGVLLNAQRRSRLVYEIGLHTGGAITIPEAKISNLLGSHALGFELVFWPYGVDLCIMKSELWRAFEEPVFVWVHGEAFDDWVLERPVPIARRLPHIRRFRFASTGVTPKGIRILYEFWPDIPIDGVQA